LKFVEAEEIALKAQKEAIKGDMSKSARGTLGKSIDALKAEYAIPGRTEATKSDGDIRPMIPLLKC